MIPTPTAFGCDSFLRYARKRLVSDLTDDDTNEDDRKVKKQKTHPHRGQIETVIETVTEFRNIRIPRRIQRMRRE